MTLPSWLAIGGAVLAVAAFALAYRRGGADAGQVVPAALSLLALAVSGLTLYYGSLAKFSPVIVAGAAVYHPNRVVVTAATPFTHLPPTGSLPGRDLQIMIPFVFTHQGGAPGVVEDVIVRLDRTDGTKSWLFQPMVFLNERAYLSQGPGKPDAEAMDSTFHPIALAKGAQVERFITFVNMPDFPKFPGGSIEPGEYALSLLVKVSSTSNYRVIERRVDVFGAPFLDDLRTGNRSAITPPSLVTLRRAIER